MITIFKQWSPVNQAWLVLFGNRASIATCSVLAIRKSAADADYFMECGK